MLVAAAVAAPVATAVNMATPTPSRIQVGSRRSKLAAQLQHWRRVADRPHIVLLEAVQLATQATLAVALSTVAISRPGATEPGVWGDGYRAACIAGVAVGLWWLMLLRALVRKGTCPAREVRRLQNKLAKLDRPLPGEKDVPLP